MPFSATITATTVVAENGDKLSPFRANTVAVSATIVAVPDDYSQSPFRANKSPKIVAVLSDYSRHFRQLLSAKTIRSDSKFQIISSLFDSKWKTTIHTALILNIVSSKHTVSSIAIANVDNVLFNCFRIFHISAIIRLLVISRSLCQWWLSWCLSAWWGNTVVRLTLRMACLFYNKQRRSLSLE